MKTTICLVLLALFASSAFAEVRLLPVTASTASPTSASFNITPVLVFTSANSSGTANDAKITSSSSTVYNPLITFGPGSTNTTIYAYSPLFVASTFALTGVAVRTINANQVVAAPTDATESSVQTADVTAAITATLRGVPGSGAVATGLGTFAMAGTVAGTQAGTTGAPCIDTLTIWTLSGTTLSQTIAVATASSTGAANGPLNTLAANALWIEDGVVYIVYETMNVAGAFAASSPYAFTPTAPAANTVITTTTAISLHAFGVTNGTKLWTAGATTLASSLTVTSLLAATYTPLTAAIGGGNNYSASSLAQVVYRNPSLTAPTVSVVTVTRSTGAIASGPTVIGTDVATTPTAMYYPGGIIGSNFTYGVLLANVTSTPTDGIMGYLNGTSTAAAATQLAIPLGTNGQLSGRGVGYGTGFGLIYKTPSATSGVSAYALQAYFANGTVNGTAVALGSFQGQVSSFIDAIGGLWVGYYTWDTSATVSSNGALTGYVGRAVAQTNYYNATANSTKAANVVATFAAILSFVIASLFMF